MIKIIKEGTKKIKECEKCGCQFSYEREDIKIYDDIEYLFGSRYKYINCPQCKEEVVLEQDK